MEGVMQKLKGPDTEGEGVILQQQWAQLHVSTTNHGIEGSAAFSTNEVSTGVNGGIHLQDGDIWKNKELFPAPNPPIFVSSSSNVTTQSAPVGIVIENKEEVQELLLKKIFTIPPSHGFYCPKCEACIEKVFVYERKEIKPTEPGGGIKCSSCFSFLIPIGRLIGLVPVDPEPTAIVTITEPHVAVTKPPVTLPGPTVTIPAGRYELIRPGSSKAWEILKSIVYGGLTELLASLSVVTSAASADATTLNIVALAIANLIGGLFVLVHNVRELKAEQPRARGEDSETDAVPVDKYYELLGHKDNFFLHAFVAIISFLVFGLVPPVVYGFSFHESDDKDLKLAAVAGASLLGITLLAIAKAYIQSTNSCMTYFKTVLYYVITGALATVLTYLAGALIKRLVENLGWFEPRSNFGLSVPEMSIEKVGWGSY